MTILPALGFDAALEADEDGDAGAGKIVDLDEVDGKAWRRSERRRARRASRAAHYCENR